MYRETAVWIRNALAAIELEPGARVIDIGSSTLHYRTIEQPHIESEVMAPLRERGLEIKHLDAKNAPGVDIIQDLDVTAPALAEKLGTFDIVLCVGVLAHVKKPQNALDLVASLAGERAWLVSTTAESYRRTSDPYDNMWRPDPREFAAEYERRGFEIARTESVRIHELRYYRGLKARASRVPVANRFWLPLPGFTERLRWYMPPLRWSDSCVVARRRA